MLLSSLSSPQARGVRLRRLSVLADAAARLPLLQLLVCRGSCGAGGLVPDRIEEGIAADAARGWPTHAFQALTRLDLSSNGMDEKPAVLAQARVGAGSLVCRSSPGPPACA